eukprot:136451_1
MTTNANTLVVMMERTKFLIIGYLLSIKQRDLIIQSVADMIYCFYLWTDKWDENKKGSNVMVNANGKSVVMKSESKNEYRYRENFCYGTEICTEGGIYQWVLKYKINNSRRNNLSIGIADKNSDY